MRPIELHPLSLAAGALVATLAFVAMAQSPQPVQPSPTFRQPGTFIEPRNMVQVREGMPYTVPAGKLLVLTALGVSKDAYGCASWTWRAGLKVNGQVECEMFVGYAGTNTDEDRSVVPFPPGLAIHAGAVVEVEDMCGSDTTGRAWGYLADA